MCIIQVDRFDNLCNILDHKSARIHLISMKKLHGWDLMEGGFEQFKNGFYRQNQKIQC